ncbi:MAG: ubiquinol-cytochrome c reductase iron-sulfur subunit [Acidimicrobiia bacterium]
MTLAISGGLVVGIGVVVLGLLAVLLVAGAARRRDTDDATGDLSRETRARDKEAAGDKPKPSRQVRKAANAERSGAVVKASSGAVAPWVPPDPEALGVSRRRFLNRAVGVMTAFSLSAFFASILGFLWPPGTGGFGSKIRFSKADLDAGIETGEGFGYFPEARMWVTVYPAAGLAKAEAVYGPEVVAGMRAGYNFLYQKCVHLGCRVPECKTSQWFECPCHGSQYNRVGERKGGPAPRGMDRFATEVDGDSFIVDTGTVIQGPPLGTNTTGQEAEGPHCIGAAEH